MKKKFLITLFSLVCVLTLVFGLAACHTHNWLSEYTEDGDRHYQTCDGCDEKKYGNHEYGENGFCVCGKQEPAEGHTHSWSQSYMNYGDRHYQACYGCEEKKYESHSYGENGFCACGKQKPADGHTHNWSSVYIEDGYRHYQTCDGCDEKQYGIHSYGDSGVCICGKYEPADGHTHIYDKQIKTEAYLKYSADCTHSAMYYFSCECGGMDAATFEFGNPNGHNFTAETIDDKYKKSDADCIHRAVYYKCCSECGEKGSVTFETGEPDGHDFGSDNICKKCSTHKPSEGLEYQINGNVASLAYRGSCTDSEIYIADTYQGFPVTSIGFWAFEDCTWITGLTIPVGITSIGEHAFYGCNGLTSITVASGNTKFHSSGNCVIETQTKTLVLGCKSSVMPADGSVTGIGKYAFNNYSSLTDISVPACITNIDKEAFSGCGGVTHIAVESGNTKYHSAGDCLIETESKTLILGCKSSVIPADGSVKIISDGAFNNCNGLTSITIPVAVTDIGSSVFSDCNALTSIYYSGNIKDWCEISRKSGLISNGCALYIDGKEIAGKITIPADVTNIGDYAFSGCNGLTNVTIGNGVTGIGKGAFSGCSNLSEIVIPSGVTGICDYAFSGCSGLTKITIPSGVTGIGINAFNGIGLTVYCEASSQPDGWSAGWNNTCPVVWNCLNNDKDKDGYAYAVIDGIRYSFRDGTATVVNQLTNITVANIPASVTYKSVSYDVTSIAEKAFYLCGKLVNLTIGNKVTNIGNSAFYGCSNLTSVTLGNGVTVIGDSAFGGCNGLTEITIPVGVTRIGKKAFYDCKGLIIYCEAASRPSGWDSSWTQIDYYGFSHCPVIWNCLNNDKDINGNIYALIDGIRYSLKDGIATVVRQSNLIVANILSTVTYQSKSYSVTDIGNYAFMDCSNLTNITIEEGIKSIGNLAFSGCDNLSVVIIPDSVTSISANAFDGCISLTSVTIGNGVTSIGYGAFQSCFDLTDVKMGNSVKSIGANAFNNCNLTSITFDGTIEQWNAIAKSSDWDRDTGDYTVHCKDGDIPKS